MRRLAAFLPSAFVLGLGLAVAFALCKKGTVEKPIPSARESGEIVVLTINGPTTYYEDAAGQPAGLEHDLARLFADELGLRIRFELLRSEADLLAALETRHGHFAAGALSPTPEREKRVRFGPAYQTITQQVVYPADQPKPRDVKDLASRRVGVLAGSHHAEKLAELRSRSADLQWQEFDGDITDALLGRLSEGSLDAVIADSNWIALSRYFYPDLAIAFDLTKPQPLEWAFPFAGDDFLYDEARKFFARIQRDGTLKRLITKYYEDARSLTKNDVAAFLGHIQTTLPRYRNLFQQAQEITGVDWRLLAAIGYQESRWEPASTSPTGVRGLMMLTEDTASRLGVKNRLDAWESIVAGAKYLLILKEGIPARIAEPDRTWLAIAAYNQGLGHLEDARILAQRLKRNPDAWADVRTTMALLDNPTHYFTLKHGYARGGEAVTMTENIRTYFDILVRLEKQPMAPSAGRDGENNGAGLKASAAR